MAGGVHPLDLHLSDRDLVASISQRELGFGQAGDLADELCVGPVYMQRTGDALGQATETFDVKAHHRAAHMVWVVVRAKGPDDAHPVAFGHVHDVIHRPGGVYDDALAGMSVPDEVHEVLHLLADVVFPTKVNTGEELAKIKGVVHEGNPSSVM